MKKAFEILKGQHGLVSVMLVALALLVGADVSFAMAETGDMTPIADDKGMATQLPGTAASGSQLRASDLADEEIDKYIAKFRPYMFPLDTDIRNQAQRQMVKGYEVLHYASGSSLMDFATTGEGSKGVTVDLKVSADVIRLLSKDMLLYFPTLKGYEIDGTTEAGYGLMLVVVEKTTSTIKVEALNGAIEGGSQVVPAIVAGTEFHVAGNAMAESQLHVEPENYQPRPNTVYLQKQGVNIVITDHWKEIAKKVSFIEQDIKDNALYNFRRRKNRKNWVGVMTKRKVYQGASMGEEYVYTSEGVLRQVLNLYGIGEELTFHDLVRLTKLQFTDYSVNNVATVYCGKNFIEKLLNIDFTKHKDISFEARTEMGIDIRAFKTTFGTLEFKHDPTLNDIGLADYAVVVDIKNAVLYVKEAGKDIRIDMKEGAGENREATRDVHIETDAIALKGYNSILVGPSGKLAGIANPNAVINFTSAATLPTSGLSDGMLVLLTADTEGWNAGQLLEYDGTTKSWKEYAGEIDA